ncbi:hypothetical protein [Cellulomonas sp. URHE0023]|uniref:hypothetical protein n=1 Tax=Cellulomonas sp. URHE0023 TaxID=1380354 RepID=UPI001E4725A7|nr:hypothetical protein [Cellulomonas sp. URHE0023]
MSRRLLVVPVALTLAGSLAACGGESSPSPSSTADQSAAQQSVEPAPVEQAAFVLSADNFAELGEQASAAKSYTLTTSIGAEGQALEMSGVVNGADAQITETVPGLDAPIEIRLVDGVVYVNLGPATGGLFWQVDPNDTNPLAASMSGATEQTSVAESVAALQPAIVSVTPVGDPEQIDGVSAQGYEVVVDTTKVTGPSGAQLAEAEAQGVDVPDQITYTYWVGTDKLPRKMSMDLMGTTTEMLFSNWGGAVTVEAPAADQITTTGPSL